MTTAGAVLLGPLAEKIRATWVIFSRHCGGCTECRGERAALMADLQDEELRSVFSRHRERWEGCCKEGRTALEPWIAAVKAHAAHYEDNRSRRSA